MGNGIVFIIVSFQRVIRLVERQAARVRGMSCVKTVPKVSSQTMRTTLAATVSWQENCVAQLKNALIYRTCTCKFT